MILMPSPPTRQGAGLILVVFGSLALLNGGIAWIMFGVVVIGAGAVLFVHGWRESHG